MGQKITKECPNIPFMSLFLRSLNIPDIMDGRSDQEILLEIEKAKDRKQ